MGKPNKSDESKKTSKGAESASSTTTASNARPKEVVCIGCGTRRAQGHCVFPSKKGPELHEPTHPANDGSWARFVAAMLDAAPQLDKVYSVRSP